MSTRTTSRLAAALAAGAALLLAACGGDDSSTGTSAPVTTTAAVTTTPAAAGAFPVTITNCGREQTFDAAPTHAVTMNQHVTEILLALGLEGSMAGTAYIDSTIRPDLLAAYDQVPVLAAEYPNREQVLAAEPDLVIGGYSSAFDDDAAGSRESLEAEGIATYLTAGYCPDFAAPNTMELTEGDITDLGAIFAVPDRAATLIATMQEPIATTTAAIAGATPVTVFVYDSGSEKAFTAAGNEMTTALIDLAGGTNIFADVDDTFTEVSWEDVVARDPDVVLILNYGSDTVQGKIDFLEQDPIASTLRAVQAESFVAVDLTDVVPGIRNGDVVLTMAQGFHPDKF